MQLKQIYRRVKTQLGLPARAPRPVPPDKLFPQDLIVHVTYHKCLTLYYKRLMNRLTAEFPFGWTQYYSDVERFHHDAFEGSGKRVSALSDTDAVQWDKLPEYRGSHFIRDPRDLLISGYHYHLHTVESWALDPAFPWKAHTTLPFFDLVEADPGKHPQDISYQAYLGSIDRERGMILEMVHRRRAFLQMGRWNYHNPRVLELKYEDVIGNEAESFRRLFEHYRFHRRVRERGVQLAIEFSLANQKKGDKRHVRRGDTGQWKNDMPVRVREVFKQAHGDLLIQLGYERDMNW